MWAECTVVES